MDQDHDAASTRAYAIWEQSGRPDGQDEAHWLQALRELGILPAVDVALNGTHGLEDLPSDSASLHLALVPPARRR
jgi:hypothetical protein